MLQLSFSFSLIFVTTASAADPAIDSTLHLSAKFADGRLQASAVVVDAEEGWAITAYHAFAKGADHQVLTPIWENGKLVTRPQPYLDQLFAGKAMRVRLVRVEPASDLALIEILKLPRQASAMELAKEGPQPGDSVRMIGNPTMKNRCWDQETGVVRDRKAMTWSWGKDRGFRSFVVEFESKIPLVDGYSGGPILDHKGHLCGLILASAKPGSTVNYGADLTVLRRFLARSYALEALADLPASTTPPRIRKALAIAPDDLVVRTVTFLSKFVHRNESKKPLFR